ncbi:peptidoglycan DD-metalloendopeptidase family protein [Streptomyces sp. NPDC050504]|uniref:peptidoglycan DD-metalloendopeptidase family protein n=1 Tax=Streptomyces sp. NPDC050504 TaxID=3365618 RepID=UPI0037880E02
MPAKGKHRRPKSNPVSRGMVVAGTGGAALALPLFAATGANAAQKAAPAAAPAASVAASAQTSAHASVQVAVKAAPQAAPAQAAPATTTYSVRTGDHLSKIADEHRLAGGWQKLYADNRATVGDDPGFILPGMKLTLGGKAKGGAAAESREAAPRAERSHKEQVPKASYSSGDQGSSESSGDRGSSNDRGSSSGEERGRESGGSGRVSGGGFTTPVSGANVTTQYRASGSSWSSGYHTGVDFAASSGTTVRAVGAGTVVSAGWSGAYGNEVVIRHTDGTYSQYAHLSSLGVSSGQDVDGGDRIGYSGSTGNSTGPHLHFEIRTGPGYGSDIDPVSYLRSHGVSL